MGKVISGRAELFERVQKNKRLGAAGEYAMIFATELMLILSKVVDAEIIERAAISATEKAIAKFKEDEK